MGINISRKRNTGQLLYKNRYQHVRKIRKQDGIQLYEVEDIEQKKIKQMKIVKCQGKQLYLQNQRNLKNIKHASFIEIQQIYQQLLSSTESEQNIKNTFIIYQHFNGKYLSQVQTNFTQQQIIFIFQQIKNGLDQLNIHNILITNLSSNTIKINSKNHIKIMNLGDNSQNIKLNDYQPAQKLFYMPPQYKNNNISHKYINIWKLGIIISQLICKQRIYSIKKKLQLNQQLKDYIIKNIKNSKLKQIIDGLLQQDPLNRKYNQQDYIEYEFNAYNFNYTNLTDKQFESKVPQKQLKTLLSLNCSNTLLTNYIGPYISNHAYKLKYINISGNQIGDYFFQKIKSILSNIKQLNISFINITNVALNLISQVALNCQTLDISFNNVDQNGILKLNSLKKLKSLYVWSGNIYYPNRYTDFLQKNFIANYKKFFKNQIKITEKVIKFLGELKLQSISINCENMNASQLIKQNMRTVEIIGTINKDGLEKICKSQNLQNVYLVDKTIEQQFKSQKIINLSLVSCSYRFESIQKLSKLQTLNLESNNLKIDKILNLIPKVNRIKKLYLANNYISSNISNLLYKVAKLQVLDLSNNFIKSGIYQITKNLNFLQALILDNNLISAQDIRQIKNLRKIKFLSLAYNNISYEGFIQILKLQNLVHLNISNNPINQLKFSTSLKPNNNLHYLTSQINKIFPGLKLIQFDIDMQSRSIEIELNTNKIEKANID